MGWFGKKSSNDTRARIEELKKKIQAEQEAYAAGLLQKGPASAPAEPAAQPSASIQESAPAPQATQSVSLDPSQKVYVQPSQPAPFAPPAKAPVRAHQSHTSQSQNRKNDTALAELEAISYKPSWESAHNSLNALEAGEVRGGVVLDLGEGMSLNLPIKPRMRMDEFLHVASRVRELQRLQHNN